MVDQAPIREVVKCQACGTACRLADGREVHPRRPDLSDMKFHVCDRCGARVGCHRGTTRPLGTPAGAALRRARRLLHERRIDPLWTTPAGETGWPERPMAARRKARTAVYEFLADRLGIPSAACHTGMFDIEKCRAAWRVLTGVTYADVVRWRDRDGAPGP